MSSTYMNRTTYYIPLERVRAQAMSLVDHARSKLLYHELAPLYNLAINRDTSREVDFLLRIIAKFHPNARSVLDLGCGVGRHSGLLNAVPDLSATGVDLSIDQIQAARRNHPGCEFIHSDMRSLSFKRQFDVAICMWTTYNYLSLPEDVAAFLQSAHEALRPPGLLVIDMNNHARDRTVTYERESANDEYSIKIAIHKELYYDICEAIYRYEILDRRSHAIWRLEDQELNKVYTFADVEWAATHLFSVVGCYGGYDANVNFENMQSDRIIVVLQKMAR